MIGLVTDSYAYKSKSKTDNPFQQISGQNVYENPSYNVQALGLSNVCNNILVELDNFDVETVMKSNPFHDSFDNFLIKADPKDMCFKLDSFFPRLLEAIPPSLILPKPIVSLAIRYIRDNGTHPRLTGESATLLKNYFMSVLKNTDRVKQPIISIDNNMFKTMLKICQIFAKFRNSLTVDECDYRMMEAFF
jgi:hypothetical protein